MKIFAIIASFYIMYLTTLVVALKKSLGQGRFFVSLFHFFKYSHSIFLFSDTQAKLLSLYFESRFFVPQDDKIIL